MNGPIHVLVIDDQDQLFPAYKRGLARDLGGTVDTVCSPAQALRCVAETLYHVVVCDAKMPYRGAVFGGVLLAEEIAGILGRHSVLLMSQYVDVESVHQLGSDLTFIKKPEPDGTMDWMRSRLPEQIREMLGRQFAFAAMPFGSPECDDMFDSLVEPVFRQSGLRLVRLDRSPFTRGIRERIFQQIRECNLVVFFASSPNPNAYLEVGFAYALGKHIVMLVEHRDILPFDIRNDYCIEYGGESREAVAERIRRLLGNLRAEHRA